MPVESYKDQERTENWNCTGTLSTAYRTIGLQNYRWEDEGAAALQAPQDLVIYSPASHTLPSTPADCQVYNSSTILSVRAEEARALLLKILLFLSFQSHHQHSKATERHLFTIFAVGTKWGIELHHSCRSFVATPGTAAIGSWSLFATVPRTCCV